MKIGLFTNNYRPLVNGLVTSVETFARAFREAGHTVAIVAPRYSDGPADEQEVLRVPGFRAPTHHAYVLPVASWPGTAKRISALELDVFHAQHPFLLGKAAARWARRSGKPLVFTYHTHYERYAHYVPGPARLVARLAVRQSLAFAKRADLVVAPGPGVARALRARGVTTRIALIPTGVPAARPTFAPSTLREILHLGNGKPVCLSVGRLAREKNQGFLLAAFAEVRRRMPQAVLLLLGEGDDRPRLERLAQDLGLGEAVRFLGAVPHERVVDYYQAADLFLFPSISETQGLVVLEALAAGVPTVAVASDASLDVLSDGQGGIVTPADPQAFAQGVADLWESPHARQKMAEAGRRAAARYSPEASAAALLLLYQELIGSRSAAPAYAQTASAREART